MTAYSNFGTLPKYPLKKIIEEMTPRQRLDYYHSERAKTELKKLQGSLVSKQVVNAGLKEAAEVIQSDLFGALPQRLAGILGGRTLSAEEVRQAVVGVVGEIVTGWTAGGLVPEVNILLETKEKTIENEIKGDPDEIE